MELGDAILPYLISSEDGLWMDSDRDFLSPDDVGKLNILSSNEDFEEYQKDAKIVVLD